MLPTAAQVRADGKRIDACPARDLAHGAVGVVVQHDHGALLRSQPLERVEELIVGMPVVECALWELPARKARLPLEVTCSESKRRAPDPAAEIPYRGASPQSLGESLGDGVRSNLPVSRVRV